MGRRSDQAGRRAKLGLDKVSGRIFDPDQSPARSKSLACPSGPEAGARFRLQQEFAAAPDGWWPSAYVDFRTGNVFWLAGLKRLDAVTCEWLPDFEPLISDSFIPSKAEENP